MKKAIVFGAGVSGKGSEKTLKNIGWEVTLVDDKTGVSSSEGIDILENEKIDIFVKSPGVPYTELVKKAMDKNIEIIDDIELGYRFKMENNIPGKIIAITGTNGKTTVTSKIKELLELAGYKAKVCGNIGFSFSETVLENRDLDFYVLELSSYQLENIKDFKADIALVVNLAPDHLNRYRDVEHYYDTKFKIKNNQKENEYFLVNTNCDNSMSRIDEKTNNIIYLGLENKHSNQIAWLENGFLIYKNEKILDASLVSLKGKHNLENMLFIVCVGKLLDIPTEIIRDFLYSTKTLEHRMENFYSFGKNTFINDSKGTNIESTRFAIEAYSNPILICGGSDKKLDLMPFAKIIKDKVKEVYLIGEIANKLEKDLIDLDYPKEKIFNLGELEKVVKLLKLKLNKDEENIILLSPATASFDQFKNFEERGHIFKELVIAYFK